MKLVDMLGLKPRPLRGPGSTPGTGTIVVIYHAALELSVLHSFNSLPYTSLPLPLCWENTFLLLVNQSLFFHLLFSYLLFFIVVSFVCYSIRFWFYR